ncbi:MAG: hypothetical protein AB2693_27230, partial [Candidatus Thiodiazotropha sp.]
MKTLALAVTHKMIRGCSNTGLFETFDTSQTAKLHDQVSLKYLALITLYSRGKPIMDNKVLKQR